MATILVVHKGGLSGIRGSEVCLLEVIDALKAAGHTVVFARNLPVIDHLVAADEIIEIDVPELLVGGRGVRFAFGQYLRSLRRLRRSVAERHVDLVFASGGLPCQLGVVVARLARISIVCHLHHPASRRFLVAWLATRADAHLFPSAYTRGFLSDAAGISGEVVYNGIDTRRFTPRQRSDALRDSLGIPADAIVLGQVGALVHHKQAEFLIRAVAASGDERIHLCIVGRGVLESSLRKLVETLAVGSRVHITGGVEDVLPYYQHVFDINVLASTEEGLGLAVLEGSACGLPAIASDCTGLRETIVHGETGYLFSPLDQSAFLAFVRELANDPHRRDAQGRAGRALVEEKFSLERFRAGVVSSVERHL